MPLRALTATILCCCLLFAILPAAAATDQRGLAVRPKAPTGDAARGDLWLLTIGINSYLSWPRLKTAVNDARAVKEVLLKRYFLDPSRVVELTDENATRHNILAAFRDLAKRVKPEDSLLVYYAGHGHIDAITGKGSWIPVESGTDDPTNWLSNRDITDYLSINAIKARHVLLVSDSCFSGDFFRGSRGGVPAIDDAYLKKAYVRSSRQAISSGGLEPVSDAGFGGNSVFSHFLVAALEHNGKPYLIPSELFNEVRSGVSMNAEQLPQFGDLHGTGGQDGGELILFLKGAAESRLQEMGAASAARQKELEQLRKAESQAAAAKQREQDELAKKQAELDALDREIAEMKGRLGTASARTSDSLDAMLAMVEQKEQQGRRLEELRRQKEAEEQKRQQEIERLHREAQHKHREQLGADIAKYQKIAASKYGQDLKGAAWDALVAAYPESRSVPRFDVTTFLAVQGLVLDNGGVVTTVEEQEQRAAERRRARAGLYEQGIEAFNKGDMKGARTALTAFLGREPNHELAGNANYWIGEAFYAEHNYEQAILAYQVVIKEYAGHEKVPACMFRQALAFKNINDVKSTRYLLKKIIADFPRSSEAPQAKALLQQL